MKFCKKVLKILYLKNPTKLAKKIGVSIGKDCRILDDPFSIFGSEPFLVKIGNHVSISSGVHFITHNGALWVFRKKDFQPNEYKRIIVENNVFIGINSIIMPGVTIGANAIVGAGSIVTKNVEANTVVCGNPAKVISTTEEYRKKVFSKELLFLSVSGRKRKKIIKEYVDNE